MGFRWGRHFIDETINQLIEKIIGTFINNENRPHRGVSSVLCAEVSVRGLLFILPRKESISVGTRVTSEQPLPVKAEREADREAGEKALCALVSLGWLWLQDRHQDRQKKKNMRAEKKY